MARSDTSATNTARSTSTSESGLTGGSSGAPPHVPGGAEAGNEGGIVNRVKQSAAAQLTSQKNRGIDALGSVAQAVRSTTSTLREEKHDTIAGYAEQAAGQIERWSERLREKDIEELVSDMHRFARRQPTVFVGSAFAVGLLAARFFKSSRPQNTYGERSETRRRYRGDSPIATVHDTPYPDAYSRGEPGGSGTTAAGVDMTTSDAGRGTRGSGGRRTTARTEKS